MADEDLWRKRFQLFMAARIFGLFTIFAGIAITFTDLVRDGGWPLVGGIVMAVGLIDSVFAPRLLKKQWEKEDRERR